MATWLELRDGFFGVAPAGGTLMFINTHLDHGSDSSRVFGAGVIMDYLTTRLSKNSLPVIVTGDMNAYEDSGAIAALCSGLGTGCLMDTFREAHPSPSKMESTSHGWFQPRSPSVVAQYGERPAPPFGRRIDYILASTLSVPPSLPPSLPPSVCVSFRGFLTALTPCGWQVGLASKWWRPRLTATRMRWRRPRKAVALDRTALVGSGAADFRLTTSQL